VVLRLTPELICFQNFFSCFLRLWLRSVGHDLKVPKAFWSHSRQKDVMKTLIRTPKALKAGRPDSTNFRPNGWLFTLGSHLKITEVSHIFGLLYSVIEIKHKFWPKMGCATFWAFFLELIWSPCLKVSYKIFGSVSPESFPRTLSTFLLEDAISGHTLRHRNCADS
jgi:hypothetical protein